MLRVIGILAKSYVVTLIDVAVVTSVIVTAAHVVARATGWKNSTPP